MINNIKSKLLFLILLVTSLTACDNNNDIDNTLPEPEPEPYLVRTIAEHHFTKNELASLVSEYAAKQGINLPTILITGLMCDIDVAAIEYNTTGPDGNNVTASGVVAIPSGTESYSNLLSIQHGTLDMEDAPSRQMFYYEMAPVVKGHIVVMADYLGYGSSQTADRQHPYLHATLTGTACADMIEAAREYLNGKDIKQLADSVELIGYSQGGQATVATLLELEKRGKAESIKNVYAGGGTYDLESVLQTFISAIESGQPYKNSGYLPYLIRGMAYGEQLELNENNIYAKEVIDNGLCSMFATRPLSEWHAALGSDLKKVINPDFLAAPSYNGNKDVVSVIEALKKNSLVNSPVKPQTTINFYHSPQDDVVPYSNAVDAHAAWPTSTLTDLTMNGHVNGGIEFVMRYMGLWDLFGPMLKSDSRQSAPINN